MSILAGSKGRGYDDSYQEFDSPLMRQLRTEAYGKDIGQHSWVTAQDLEQDASRLKLSRASRLLDLGCGPAGPLAFVVGLAGCRASGVDASANAIAAGRARAATLGPGEVITFQEADLNEPLPFPSASFDVVMSLDVILHLPDRGAVFREVARVLVPGGRFLFTDAGVITGSISDEEMRLRAVHGPNHFVPPGFNERMLELAGFRLLESADRTLSLLQNARGRLAARLAHRAELEKIEGSANFERQQRYLETVIGLSDRGAVSRMMYLAESHTA
ncbi:MAG: class I SAM-dependent methyltransferase [Acidobacteriia bacterium]|nr:class I SAM-dependent methyltransferase [Terriglobia bacterium]